MSDKDYKSRLNVLKGASEARRTELLNKPSFNITTYDQKSYEAAGGKGKAKFKDYKSLGVKNEDEYFKIKNKAKAVITKAAKRSPAGKAVSAILKGGSYIKDLIK
tara:strand:- start:11794 stop:12108 length:315 start_codon:yes stop_codon:yes gene_type:complete